MARRSYIALGRLTRGGYNDNDEEELGEELRGGRKNFAGTSGEDGLTRKRVMNGGRSFVRS